MADAGILVLTGDADGRGPSAGSAADCNVLGDALAGGGEATQSAGLVIEQVCSVGESSAQLSSG